MIVLIKKLIRVFSYHKSKPRNKKKNNNNNNNNNNNEKKRTLRRAEGRDQGTFFF
jgi:hypothetical protein